MTTRDAKGEWFDDDKPPGPPDGEPVDDAAGDEPAASADRSDPDRPVTGSGDPDFDAEAAQLLDEGLIYGESENFDEGVGLASDAASERDEYRDALLRVKADFDNYRKRVAKDNAATVERAAEKLVAELLPVLDACEAALGHGSVDVEPIYKSLLDTLEKSGLVRMDPEGLPFDPNLHEAVLHEPGDDDETVVLESLRTGYVWKGRVIRPAMVKVKG